MLRDDGILQVNYKEGVEITRADVTSLLWQKTIWTEKKVPLLADYRTSHSIHFDVFVQGVADVVNELSAIAYVVESSVGQRVAKEEKEHFFEGLPVEIFFSMRAGEDWLLQHV